MGDNNEYTIIGRVKKDERQHWNWKLPLECNRLGGNHRIGEEGKENILEYVC